MRRKALIGALLLPLPFAALPVLAVLMGGLVSSSAPDTLLQAPAAIQDTAADYPQPGSTLAYGLTEPSYEDCPRDTVSNIGS